MHQVNSIEEMKTCEQFHLIFKASKLMKTDCSFELDTGDVIIYFEGKKLRKILFYLMKENTLQRRYNAGDGSHKIELRYK